jgi:hypothetical protein
MIGANWESLVESIIYGERVVSLHGQRIDNGRATLEATCSASSWLCAWQNYAANMTVRIGMVCHH